MLKSAFCPQMRRLPALVASLLLPASQPMLLGTELSTASLLVSESPARAQIPVDALLEKSRALQGKKGSEWELNSDAFFFRALAKFDLGDKQGAIADYNQAIAINPQFADAFYNRGLAKSDLGDKRGAIADYNQAIAIKPQFANAFYNRGLAKSDLGDKRGSIADYSQAIAINPQHADAYNNRGVAKSILGDKRGAIADYSQALAIDPFYADAYNNRGDAKFSLGDKRGACADYTKSVSGPGSQYSKAERWYYGEGGVWCRYMHLDRQLLP